MGVILVSDQRPEPSVDPGPAAATAPITLRPPYLWPGLIIVVITGGALGTLARYGIAEAVPTAKDGWPIATLIVNLAGAFILGVLLEALARRGPDIEQRRRLRLFAGTGFCGGFTTCSALAVELDLLLRDHQLAIAAGYAAVTLVGGLLAAVAGIALAAGHHQWQLGRRTIDPDVIEEPA